MQLGLIPVDITPRWVRQQRSTPKDLRQAHSISSTDASSSFQSFPNFFVLGDQATSSHGRVELRVAVKGDASNVGMVQRILQVDVHAAKFSILSFPTRHVLESFQISHLVEADYPGDLVIRLGFRQSIPGWISEKLQTKQSQNKREQIWIRTFHTMTSNQRDYLGALLQGLVGLNKPLNANRHLLCSPQLLKLGREQVSLWIGTWNMGNKPAPDLVPSKHGLINPVALWVDWNSGNEHDFYAFGFQELDPSIFAVLDQHFTDKGYVQVCRTIMGVIALTVFCKRRLFGQLSNVQTMVQACGFAGVGTNKGFVCCSMTVLDQPLLFINCHLAARDDAKRLKERIHQYKLAVKKLQVGKLPGTDALHQHTTFFFGDMNFRINTTDKDLWPNSGRTRQEVLDTLYGNKGLDFALQGDQLSLERARGTIFHDFSEAPITFSPTYKYLVFPRNTVWEEVRHPITGKLTGFTCAEREASEFSKQSAVEDGQDAAQAALGYGYYLTCRTTPRNQHREYTTYKSQVPSWCDRILHSAPLPGVRVRQKEYYCVDTIASSDHSPTYASFAVELPQTSSAVPAASFHVCAIQLLSCEVFYFRHPLMPVDGTAGYHELKTGEDDGDDGEDDEDEEEQEQQQQGVPKTQQLKKASKQPETAAAVGDVEGDVADDSSEPEIYSSKRVLPTTTPTSSSTKKNVPLVYHFPQLVCAAVMPFLRETSTKSRITSKPAMASTDVHTWKPNCDLSSAAATGEDQVQPEFVFRAAELGNMAVGPFLCTREFLQNQYFVLHLLPKTGSETRDSAACCVISLEEGADGRTVNFEEKLSHFGQPSGFVRGKYRVWMNSDGWEEEYVANPALHPFYPANLARTCKARRNKSPPPPHGRKTPVHPLPVLRAKTRAMGNPSSGGGGGGDAYGEEDCAQTNEEEEDDEDGTGALFQKMDVFPPSIPRRAPKQGDTSGASGGGGETNSNEQDDDDDEEEDEDEDGQEMDEELLDQLTRQNTILNHRAQVTAFQTVFEPRVKSPKPKKRANKQAVAVQPSKRGGKLKLGPSGSIRRISMMWGAKMNE